MAVARDRFVGVDDFVQEIEETRERAMAATLRRDRLVLAEAAKISEDVRATVPLPERGVEGRGGRREHSPNAVEILEWAELVQGLWRRPFADQQEYRRLMCRVHNMARRRGARARTTKFGDVLHARIELGRPAARKGTPRRRPEDERMTDLDFRLLYQAMSNTLEAGL